MTRTEAIQDVVLQALDEHRGALDTEANLSYLVIEIACRPGELRPRKVRLTRKTERDVE